MSEKPNVKILVPIGFSEQSLIALDHAVLYAKKMGAGITLLSVIEKDGLFSRIFSDKSIGEKLHKEVRENLEELAAKQRKKTGISFDCVVSDGVVYEEIAKTAHQLNVDLVVMGTNGKPSNFRQRMIGSNAYRTVSLCKPPVVTIGGSKTLEKIERIVFPIVADRKSREKTGTALRIARLFGSKIIAVAFVTKESEKKSLSLQTKQVVKFIRSKGVECDFEIIEPENKASVGLNTVKYAEENDGDMIMITDEGEEPNIADMLLGTDVRDVIYHAEIPVMSVTPSADKYLSIFQS